MNGTAINLGFVGAGRMAQAIGRGIAGSSGIAEMPARFFDPDDAAAGGFSTGHPDAIRVASAAELAGQCRLLVLAVKPQVMPEVLADLQPVVESGHLVVSVAAGVTLATLGQRLSTERLIRAMPNTPCLIGRGMTALAAAPAASAADRERVRIMFDAVGDVVEVDESRIDAVTGLSGSGPAYVFSFIESLIAGGVEAGLEESLARQLALQTVLGAGQLMRATGKSAAELRHQVTSPGGTTLAGLEALHQAGFARAVTAAVSAATHRAGELAEQAGRSAI